MYYLLGRAWIDGSNRLNWWIKTCGKFRLVNQDPWRVIEVSSEDFLKMDGELQEAVD